MADLSLDSLVGGSGNLQTGTVVTDYNSTLKDGTALYPLDGSLISRSTNPVLSTKFPFVYGQDMQKIDLGITTGSNSAWVSDNQGAAASSGDNILLGVDGTSNHQSIIYSSDAGVTWSYAYDAPSNFGGGLKIVLDGTYGAFSLNSTTSNSHFAFSSDSGANFAFINTNQNSKPLDLAIDTSSNYMLLAFENGVLARITNLASPSVSALITSPTGGTAIKSVACSGTKAILMDSTERLFYSTNSGASWTNSGFTVNNQARDRGLFMEGDVCFAYDSTNAIYRSIDAGVNWTDITSNLPTELAGISSMCFENGVLIVTRRLSDGLGYSSTDNGNTWSEFSWTPSSQFLSPDGITVTDSNEIYITDGRGLDIYKSSGDTTSIKLPDLRTDTVIQSTNVPYKIIGG